MKTLVFANQKGGVGKTSILSHFVFSLAEQNKKTLVLDLDTQGNASFTLSNFRYGILASHCFARPGVSAELFAEAFERKTVVLLPADNTLANLDKQDALELIANFQTQFASLDALGLDYVLIDTAPAIGVRLSSALAVAA